jgi:undecaprenyl-diphosphatase
MFGEGLWGMALISPLLLIVPRVNAAALYAAPFVLVFTHLPKHLLHWPRPSTVLVQHGAHLVDSPMAMNTFPSGHSIVAGMVGAVLILGWGAVARRPWAHLSVLVGVTLVCWSRVAVGAHWPSDVLVGAALGVLAGYLGTALAQRFNPESRRACITVAVIYALAALALALIPTHRPLQDEVRDILAAIGLLSTTGVIARVQIAELVNRIARTRSGPMTPWSQPVFRGAEAGPPQLSAEAALARSESPTGG